MAAQTEPYEAPAIRAYAITLTSWRVRSELSKAGLAERLGYTPQLITQIEAFKNIPSRKFSEDLDTFFKTGGIFAELWKLIHDTRHLIALPPGFSKYLELEGMATRIYIFEALLITGLLQTEGYARAITGSLMTSEAADQAVRARMERKQIFSRPEPPRTFFIVEELALHRTIGSTEVTKEQLGCLIELSERPDMNIQVLPRDTEHYVAYSGSFTILGFKHEPDIAYIEAAGQGNLITGSSSVANCAIRYDLLRSHAYSVSESRRVIRKAMESI